MHIVLSFNLVYPRRDPVSPSIRRQGAVAQGKIESERGSDVIREEVVRQFGSHLPLHRCAILVLSQESYLPRADDLHATY